MGNQSLIEGTLSSGPGIGETKRLQIFSLDGWENCCLPKVHALSNWPFEREDSPGNSEVEKYEHIKSISFKFIPSTIGMLVGINVPDLLMPLEIVSGRCNEPYATRHKFGWALSGPTSITANGVPLCHRISAHHEGSIEDSFSEMYAQDFDDPNPEEKGFSFEDKLWLDRVSSSINRLLSGHYEIDLPFRNNNVKFPCNFRQAIGCLQSLKRRLLSNPKLYDDYKEFMGNMIAQGYLELIPTTNLMFLPGKGWYLVHYDVYHKIKNKIRIVFDCSLKNGGVSLNAELLQGPDLTNSLVGVLLRFREGRVAIMTDIEAMFVQVPPAHCNYMRVLWYKNGNFGTYDLLLILLEQFHPLV